MMAEGSKSEKRDQKMVAAGESSSSSSSHAAQKTPFRLAKDDTKPFLRDPILRSDPIETEEAVLRLPPFPNFK